MTKEPRQTPARTEPMTADSAVEKVHRLRAELKELDAAIDPNDKSTKAAWIAKKAELNNVIMTCRLAGVRV